MRWLTCFYIIYVSEIEKIIGKLPGLNLNHDVSSIGCYSCPLVLTLIWVGFLLVRFDVYRGGRGGKITPCLKLVRIMLETSNLVRKYTRICSFRKYTF